MKPKRLAWQAGARAFFDPQHVVVSRLFVLVPLAPATCIGYGAICSCSVPALSLGCGGACSCSVFVLSLGCRGVCSKPVPALRGMSVPVGAGRPFGPACPHPPGLRPPFCGAWLDRQRPAQTYPASQELHWHGYTALLRGVGLKGIVDNDAVSLSLMLSNDESARVRKTHYDTPRTTLVR